MYQNTINVRHLHWSGAGVVLGYCTPTCKSASLGLLVDEALDQLALWLGEATGPRVLLVAHLPTVVQRRLGGERKDQDLAL